MDITELIHWFWWILGGVLIISEFIIPGLVVVFVGMGAITVAILKHYGVLEGLNAELLVWFASSLFYIFTLRFLVIKIYPSDTKKQNIDEDKDVFGQMVEVIKEIPEGGIGRVNQGESTWPAISDYKGIIHIGEKVEIVGRDNLTWKVCKKD